MQFFAGVNHFARHAKIINHESKYKLQVQMRCRVSNQLTDQIHGHQVKSSDEKRTMFHL